MIDVLVIGAGASGLGAAIALRDSGRQVVLLEGAERLGGTWRDNVYPGVAVDIPVTSYCFPFEMGFSWSRRYAPGHEILAYLDHCATKYGVDDQIRYGCRVARADFDADSASWTVTLTDGRTLQSRFLIAATGIFAKPVTPDFPGHFDGISVHTARWNTSLDLAGKRVGIIGTGASATQAIPIIAREAAHLTVFQRTPIWVAPRFDHDLRPDGPSPHPTLRQRAARSVSETTLELLTMAVVRYARAPRLFQLAQAPVRAWMRRQIDDPAIAEKLIPSYALGCKRPATSNDYLATFNRDNVFLETSPIARLDATGVVVEPDQLHALDVLVYATGFQTTARGNQPSFPVYGPGEQELGAFWEADRFSSYGGIAVEGFPNLFLTHGPYSGGFNWFAMLETHLGQIRQCLEQAWATGATRVAIREEPYREHIRAVRDRATETVFLSDRCASARSYYIDLHGDASLPSPRTPRERARWAKTRGVRDFDFD